MGHKIMHMEPTDESDGFVNITPDPSAHLMVGDWLYFSSEWFANQALILQEWAGLGTA